MELLTPGNKATPSGDWYHLIMDSEVVLSTWKEAFESLSMKVDKLGEKS